GLVEDGAAVGEQQPTEVLGDLETGDAALHQPVDVGATVAVGVARQRFRRSPQLGERGGWLDAGFRQVVGPVVEHRGAAAERDRQEVAVYGVDVDQRL